MTHRPELIPIQVPNGGVRYLAATSYPWGGRVDGLAEHVEIARIGSAAGDAFGRLRVANPSALLEVSFDRGHDPDELTSPINVVGTPTVVHDGPHLDVTVAAGERYERRTDQYALHQPGKAQVARLTSWWGEHVPGVRCWSQYGDDEDALGFERTVDGVEQFYLLSSTQGRRFEFPRLSEAQGGPAGSVGWDDQLWDGDDLLELVHSLHLVIDDEWLSVGIIRFGFQSGEGGPTWCFTFDAAFNPDVVGAVTGSNTLPLSWGVDATAAAAAANVLFICGQVSSEGGHDPIGLPMGVASTAKTVTGATRYPLISLRPTLQFPAGKTNRGHTHPVSFAIRSTADVLVEVIQDTTLTGATWALSPADEGSHAEADVAATATAGGRVLTTAFVSSGIGSGGGQIAQSELSNRAVILVVNAPATSQATITVAVTPLVGGVAAGIYGTINWEEAR